MKLVAPCINEVTAASLTNLARIKTQMAAQAFFALRKAKLIAIFISSGTRSQFTDGAHELKVAPVFHFSAIIVEPQAHMLIHE